MATKQITVEVDESLWQKFRETCEYHGYKIKGGVHHAFSQWIQRNQPSSRTGNVNDRT